MFHCTNSIYGKVVCAKLRDTKVKCLYSPKEFYIKGKWQYKLRNILIGYKSKKKKCIYIYIYTFYEYLEERKQSSMRQS